MFVYNLAFLCSDSSGGCKVEIRNFKINLDFFLYKRKFFRTKMADTEFDSKIEELEQIAIFGFDGNISAIIFCYY